LLVKKKNLSYSRNSSALAAARQLLENELDSIRQAGTFKHERVITSKQAVTVQVQGQLQPLLNFCANNYLGLSVLH
jgi:glycine C-acetyltransferase